MEKKVAKWDKKRQKALIILTDEEEDTAISVGEIIAEYVLKFYRCCVEVHTNDGYIEIRIAGKQISTEGTVYEQREAEATQQFLKDIGFLCDEFEERDIDNERWWTAEVKLAEKVHRKSL